jgi:hypothetical protein
MWVLNAKRLTLKAVGSGEKAEGKRQKAEAPTSPSNGGGRGEAKGQREEGQ